MSGWTIETLLEFVNARIADMELRNQQRFEAQTKAIEAAITAQRAAVDAALVSADRATAKAETATEARFASVNEFRQQLNDQAATFMPRKETEGLATRNAERIQDLSDQFRDAATKAEVINAFEGLSARLKSVEDYRARSEGKGAGLNAGWVYILGAIAALGTIVSLYLLVK